MKQPLADARAAQRAWATTPINERLRIVTKVRHGLATHGKAFGEAVRDARRGRLHEALASEVLPLAEACRFMEEQAARLLRPQRLRGRRPWWLGRVEARLYREPFGVVLVLAPANYPLFLAGVQVLQAIVAGNAIMLKPGTRGTPVAELWRALWLEAGLDPRLFVLLGEEPEQAREAMAAGVDKVVLTGHARTGQAVLAELAPRLVPATLELSGCDAAFVLPDADIDRTARALLFGLQWNESATCIAPRRVFLMVEQLSALSNAFAAMRPRSEEPLPAHVTARIEEAVANGATLLMGTPTHGPTIILTTDGPLLREEIFAPVLALVVVTDMDQALAIAARCPYQLGATIFGDVGAHELAQRVAAGCVLINDAIVPTADPRWPFGGRGQSGYGVTRGGIGLLEMTTIKVVGTRHGSARHLDDLNFADAELFRLYLAAMHGPTWWGRWRAKGQLARHLWTRSKKEPRG